MKKTVKFLLIFLLIGSGIININSQKAMASVGYSITEAQVHVQDIGWMPWVKDGYVGTVGKGLRMEAIKIRFLPPYNNMSNLHVQYRVHVKNIGWMPWVKDGESAGTIGQSLGIEAIQTMIVDDNGQRRKDFSIGSEAVHIQNLGWISGGGDGTVIGTTGKGLNMEAVSIKCVTIK